MLLAIENKKPTATRVARQFVFVALPFSCIVMNLKSNNDIQMFNRKQRAKKPVKLAILLAAILSLAFQIAWWMPYITTTAYTIYIQLTALKLWNIPPKANRLRYVYNTTPNKMKYWNT